MLAMNLYNKIYPNKEIPALETKFTDCRNDPNVNNAAALGIVTGYEDGTFRPYKTISRQELPPCLTGCIRYSAAKRTWFPKGLR